MTDQRYFNSEHVERISEAWADMKENTRKSYIVATKMFFDCMKTTPEKLKERDIRNFFSGGVEGSGKQRYIAGELSRTYYRLVIMAAKKFIASWYDRERAEKLLACFENAPSPVAKFSACKESSVEEYLKLVAGEDRGLFMACILAYGACLAPKEIFSLKKNAFFEKDGWLCLSVGMGTNHRYIRLPVNTSLFLADFIKDLDPPKDINIFDYDCRRRHKGSPVRCYNRMLKGLHFMHKIPGIDSMTLQQFRTISMSSMTKNAGNEDICDYCAVSVRYLAAVKKAFAGKECPDDVIKRAGEEVFPFKNTDPADLGLRTDIKKSAYIVKYPFYAEGGGG